MRLALVGTGMMGERLLDFSTVEEDGPAAE